MSLSGDRERIEISDELGAKLDAACAGQFLDYRRKLFDTAINDALDAAGWPRAARERVDVPMPPSYWYVTILESDRPIGHVGPIHEIHKARRAARSWRETGKQTLLGRTPIGENLTNLP